MTYGFCEAAGLKVFYRECGRIDKPVFLLLHGFPSASHQFRNLMPRLEEKFHLIAPDLIGFGQSEAPGRSEFAYTFEHLTDVLEAFLEAMSIHDFYVYVFDYGAPIGFRLALRHPERILGIVSQNGNIYEEGLGRKWEARKAYWENPTEELRRSFASAFAPETIVEQYKNGEKEGSISPDGYSLDIFYSYSDGYAERQNDLIFDYQTNVAMYPAFQQYLREYRPKVLAAWGKNDPSFLWAGAEAFQRDDKNARAVPLEGGHFALETHDRQLASLIMDFFEEE